MEKKLKLFDDDEDFTSEGLSRIEINREYARRYKHNKEREDLNRLSDLRKQGRVDDDDVSSSDESDSGEITDPKKVSDFVDALIKVKNHDPVLRQKDVKLFSDEIGENGNSIKGNKKGEKPKYLKDVVAEQLLRDGPEFDEGVVSYVKEQEGLRRGVVEKMEKAVDEVAGEGEGGLFRVKEGGSGVTEEGEDEVAEKLDEYFGKDEVLDEKEVFLKRYFRNRMWVGEDEGVGEEGLELSDDEVAIEEQEDYERGFNFRYEENAGDRVMGHSRVVEGSVRKKTNARKAQRESKAEREAQVERERKEELKRLKNVKKREMREKLEKIKETAGIEGDWVCPLDEDDLEDEFDPEEHDRKMREAFNDEYYGKEDVDPEFGSDEDENGEIEKPDFDKEDELLGLGKGWDEAGSKDGFLAAREKFLKRKAGNEGHLEKIAEEEEEGEGEVNEGKRKKKRKMSKMEKEVLDKELEEYYKLDYEDSIGDLKTRFKYREVGQKRYGLSTEEIFMLDDKELNQYVSIKRLAPYREKEWNVPRNTVLTQKQKNKKLLKGERLDDQENDDEKKLKIEENKSEDEGMKGDTSQLSRKRRKKKTKLPSSRLKAYGK